MGKNLLSSFILRPIGRQIPGKERGFCIAMTSGMEHQDSLWWCLRQTRTSPLTPTQESHPQVVYGFKHQASENIHKSMLPYGSRLQL